MNGPVAMRANMIMRWLLGWLVLNSTRLELARDTPYEHVFRAPQHALGDLVHMTVHDLRQLGAPRKIPFTRNTLD